MLKADKRHCNCNWSERIEKCFYQCCHGIQIVVWNSQKLCSKIGVLFVKTQSCTNVYDELKHQYLLRSFVRAAVEKLIFPTTCWLDAILSFVETFCRCASQELHTKREVSLLLLISIQHISDNRRSSNSSAIIIFFLYTCI